MFQLIFIGLLLNSVHFSFSADSVCYDVFGCFSLDAPWKSWKRPFAVLPQDPFKINTRYLLYTRTEPQETELLINKTMILQMSEFNSKKMTRILIHGFLGSGYDKWVQDMKTTLLNQEDSNVIIVEWKAGSQLPYSQAVANIRLVGVHLAQMINFLNTEGKQSFQDMHLIGHDLGAHAAGYAGKRIQTLGRITGLDPIEPYFSGTDTILRLDSTDADYVDVIHTDGSSFLFLGLGMKDPIGHADFYPNNGKDQPGCGDLLDRIKGSVWDLLHLDIIGAQQTFACSHKRAVDIFTESISTNCPYVAIPCDDWDNFQNGKCKQYDQGHYSQIGFNSDKFKKSGKIYLSTNGQDPYCQYTHLVSLTTSSNQKSVHGIVSVKLIGRSGQSEFARINSASTHIQQSQLFITAVNSRLDIGDIKEVQVKYKDNALIFHGSLHVDKITVQSLDSKLRTHEFRFCAYGKQVNHDETVTVEKNDC